PIDLMKVAQAFAAWEAGYRTFPNAYLTQQDCQEMHIDQLSADRAVYLLGLMADLESLDAAKTSALDDAMRSTGQTKIPKPPIVNGQGRYTQEEFNARIQEERERWRGIVARTAKTANDHGLHGMSVTCEASETGQMVSYHITEFRKNPESNGS